MSKLQRISSSGKIIEKVGYNLKETFNFDETDLNISCMPFMAYISNAEKHVPEFKTTKVKVKGILVAKVSGDLKIKPLMIYQSVSRCALRRIIKSSLGVKHGALRRIVNSSLGVKHSENG